MAIEEERWVTITGYEGYYEVSDRGRVRSLDRLVPHALYGQQKVRGRLMTQRPNDDGYPSVLLSRDGRNHTRTVHRIVALEFVPGASADLEVCHRDGDPSNNAPENLRWDTHSANTLDKVAHGRHPMASKTHCKRGHEFTEENTYRRRTGRECRACRQTRGAAAA